MAITIYQRIRAAAITAFGIVCLGIACFSTGSALAQPTCEISPTSVLLGQFCAVDVTENIWGPGNATVRLQSDVPWSLMASLTAPVRRVSDNLELPAERARELFPDIGEDFANYLPFELDYGPGSVEVQTFSYDWQVLQLRLEQFLEPEDPPGTYRAEVNVALADRDGNFLTDPQVVIFEFEILPWIETELLGELVILTVSSQSEYSESEPLPLRIRSNSAWILHLSCTGDFHSINGEGTIDQELAAWMVPSGDGWESLVPEYAQVHSEPSAVARGDDPEPFTINEVEIPLRFRCGPMGLIDQGEFSADIEISAAIEISAQ